MPDIEDLLSGAARPPGRSLDLGAVRGRAEALRRQRRALRAGPPALLATLLVAALVLPWGGDSRPDSLQPARPQPTAAPTSAAPPATTAPVPGLPLAPTDPVAPPGTPAPSPGARSGTAGGAPSARPATAPAAASATPRPGSEAAPMASCSVSTTPSGPDPTDTCTFTATADGGADVARGLRSGDVGTSTPARLTVVRDGVTVLDRRVDDCFDDVIRRGDVVRISISRADGAVVEEATLSAGEGFGC